MVYQSSSWGEMTYSVSSLDYLKLGYPNSRIELSFVYDVCSIRVFELCIQMYGVWLSEHVWGRITLYYPVINDHVDKTVTLFMRNGSLKQPLNSPTSIHSLARIKSIGKNDVVLFKLCYSFLYSSWVISSSVSQTFFIQNNMSLRGSLYYTRNCICWISDVGISSFMYSCFVAR